MAEVVQAGRFLIPVLYEDNHLLVVVKPPNLPSQADSSGDEDLLGILKGYIGKKYQKPGNVYLGLVHRLDHRRCQWLCNVANAHADEPDVRMRCLKCRHTMSYL